MTASVSHPRRLSRLLALIGLSAPLLAWASPAGDALQRLQGDTWVNRSFALSDLGFGEDVLLSGYDSRQEFYLPVPRTLHLADASVDFRGRYYKAEEGRTSMLLFVNGKPVHSRRIDTSEGDASQLLKVDVSKPGNGFLRFRVDWLNNVGQRICDVERSTGNVLSVSSDTRFNYRFSSAALTSLADAWLTLPAHPTLLVASRSLNKTAYDTAWRLGVALEQANRRVQVKSFPSPGDMVDTTGWQLPPGLANVPAFAALGQNEAKHALKDEAEVGALVVLGSSLATGDIVVADPVLQKQVAAALDALGAQLSADPDATRALATWRSLQTALGAAAVPSHSVRLATLGAHPVIVVAEDAGAKAAGAFADVWRNALTARNVVIAEANAPEVIDQAALRLTNLGGSDANFDVLAHGDWTATLPLAAVAVNGRMPTDLVVDVAAAPGASSTRPVASVFWNNVLLSARRLQADGHPERLDARVPGYALGLSNVVRVSFQRQPYSNDCNETPQAFPVSVLPTSYVRGGDSEPDGTFVGLLPLMSGTPELIIPQAYLADAPTSLMRVVRMAVAAGRAGRCCARRRYHANPALPRHGGSSGRCQGAGGDQGCPFAHQRQKDLLAGCQWFGAPECRRSHTRPRSGWAVLADAGRPGTCSREALCPQSWRYCFDWCARPCELGGQQQPFSEPAAACWGGGILRMASVLLLGCAIGERGAPGVAAAVCVGLSPQAPPFPAKEPVTTHYVLSGPHVHAVLALSVCRLLPRSRNRDGGGRRRHPAL
jgi:hypothetical protein